MRHTSSAIIIACLMLSAAACDFLGSETPPALQWEQQNESIIFSSYAVTPQGNLFAYHQPTRSYLKSTAEGSTWAPVFDLHDPWVRFQEPIGIGLNEEIYLSVMTERVAAAYMSGLFRSTDAGSTWSLLPQPEWLNNADITALSVSLEGHVYVSTGQIIYRSEDQGQNWTQLGPLSGEAVNRIVAGSEGLIFAVGHLSLSRSANGGQSWTVQSLPAIQPRNILIKDRHKVFMTALEHQGGTVFKGVIFRSEDGGQKWVLTKYAQTLREDQPWNPQRVPSLVVNSRGGLFASAAFGGVLYSPDDGRSWQAVNAGLPMSAVGSLIIAAGELNIDGNDFLYTTELGISSGGGRGIYKTRRPAR